MDRDKKLHRTLQLRTFGIFIRCLGSITLRWSFVECHVRHLLPVSGNRIQVVILLKPALNLYRDVIRVSIDKKGVVCRLERGVHVPARMATNC